MFEFTYKLKNKDYQEFNDHHFKNKILLNVLRFIFFVIIPMVFYVAVLYDLALETKELLLEAKPRAAYFIAFIIASIVILLVCIISLVIIYFILNLIWKIIWNIIWFLILKNGNFIYKDKQTVRFDNDKFLEINGLSTNIIDYSKIHKLVKTKKAIYIYINQREALILPMNVFTTVQQKEEFWHFINYKVSSANKSEAIPCIINEDHLFRFDFEVTRDDYINFEKHFSINDVVHKKIFLIIRLIFIALPLYFLLQSIVMQDRVSEIRAHVIELTIAVLIFFYWKYLVVGFIKLYHKCTEKKGKLPNEGLYTVAFYETMITEVSDRRTIERSYKEIRKIEIVNQAVYLYTTDVQAVIMPLHIFETEEQKAAFITFIQQKTSAS